MVVLLAFFKKARKRRSGLESGQACGHHWQAFNVGGLAEITANSFDRVNESQTPTAKHRRETMHSQEPFTVVADMITELIRFEPEICICNRNQLEFKRESVSVMRDFMLKFPQICLCNGN